MNGPDLYINRELSLLAFQERVLAMAADEGRPLLERVNFLAIVSNNLDEFLQVRVSGLAEQARLGIEAPSPDGRSPTDQLTAIRKVLRRINAVRDGVYGDLYPQMCAAGIGVYGWEDLTESERDELSRVFEADIFPVLTPLAVDPAHPFPYISNLSLNLAVQVRSPDAVQSRFARVKLPPSLPRFLPVAGKKFLPLEELVGAHLDRLFPNMDVIAHHPFRVIRNADIALEEDEAEDLMSALETGIQRQQRFSVAIAVVCHPDMPADVLDLLVSELQIDGEDVYRLQTPLDLSGLWAVVGLDRPELKERHWNPVIPPAFVGVQAGSENVFDVIGRGDVLVHHPYESFAASTATFIAQAAADPQVLAIKQTLYRTSLADDPALGGEEAIVRSLVSAADAGKQVVTVVELRARGDEQANIRWARLLEEAGVHVVYGVVGLKTHAKIALVVRRESGRLRRYSHIGTGNYNPKTARLYEDLGLFTADAEIGTDLAELFNVLTGYGRLEDYRHILVAPTAMRRHVIAAIRGQTDRGSAGRIVIKANHLVDTEVIDALYAASSAGVEIDLIIRGMCALRPQVPGLSDNIRVRSIVGRWLEHSRIYRFGDSDGADYYIGSADLMPRNLTWRVEALTPVTDRVLRNRLEEILSVCLDDDAQAWELASETWSKVPVAAGVATHRRLQDIALDRARAQS